MSKIILTVMGVFCLSLYVPMFASGRSSSVEGSIQKTKDELRDAEWKLLLEARSLDTRLAAKGLAANTADQIKLIFKNMKKDYMAKSRMESRDTRRHEEGKAELNAYVSKAKTLIFSGKQQLEAIAAAEYAEWAAPTLKKQRKDRYRINSTLSGRRILICRIE